MTEELALLEIQSILVSSEKIIVLTLICQPVIIPNCYSSLGLLTNVLLPLSSRPSDIFHVGKVSEVCRFVGRMSINVRKL